jgi:hypothetical protein
MLINIVRINKILINPMLSLLVKHLQWLCRLEISKTMYNWMFDTFRLKLGYMQWVYHNQIYNQILTFFDPSLSLTYGTNFINVLNDYSK